MKTLVGTLAAGIVAAGLLAPMTTVLAAPVSFSGSTNGVVTLSGNDFFAPSPVLWTVTNGFHTDNGRPAGGNGVEGNGLAVLDGQFTNPNQNDAFDGANLVFIDDVQFVAPDTVDVTRDPDTLSAGPVLLSGLQVSVQYQASGPVLRTLVSLHNPSAALIKPKLSLVTNVGSDRLTTDITSPPSPGIFPITITSDDPVAPTDPVNVFVFRGSGDVADFPSISATVFNQGDTHGQRADLEPRVPPGDTVHLMFFNAIARTIGNAINLAILLSPNPTLDGLLSGLTRDDTFRIGNWNFFGEYEVAGGGATWTFSNQQGTSNGVATGGRCVDAPAFGVEDEKLASTPARDDAFDGGLLVFVGGNPVRTPTVLSDGQTLTTSPQTLAGLDVSLEYAALQDTPTLRTRVLLTNPGTTDVTTTVQVATNFGSDDKTTVRAANDGAATNGPGTRWVVTSDQKEPSEADVVNTSVIAGPGRIAVAPVTSSTVFDCTDPDGLLAEYAITIPAGTTRALLLFNEIHDSITAATETSARFDTTPASGDALVAGLDAPALLAVANWDFCGTLLASFASIGCGLDGLDADLRGALQPGTSLDKLAASVAAARNGVGRADALRAQGKTGPARQQLRIATKALKALIKRVGSKAYASLLTDAQRQALGTAATALNTRITAVGSSL
jgi:hypothetical protein